MPCFCVLLLFPHPEQLVRVWEQMPNGNSTPTVLMRATGPTGELVSTARRVFRELVSAVPVEFSTFKEELNTWLANRKFLLSLVGVFAAAALLLMSVGLYGVIAFFVTLRIPEIGIRMAIGASRTDVLRLVLGESLRIATIGVAIGLATSFAVTRLLSSFLFGVSAVDPLTFAIVALLLCLVALAASYIPARRAVRIDPVRALRYE